MRPYASYMGRSYTNINVHIIFHTKSGAGVIAEAELPQIFRYIGGVIRSLSGFAFIVGGRPDHIHILASVPVTLSLSEFIGRIKSNTSRWIKELHERYKDFSWQEGYGAFSVSESNKDEVIKYILNQEQHHRRCSAQEEFLRFLERNRISSDYAGRDE